MLRFTFAFLLAPFPAAFIQSGVVALWPKEGMGVFEHPSSMFVAICILFYGFGLILGIPLLLLLRKRSSGRIRGYALSGMIVALAPVAVALGWASLRGDVSIYTIAYNLAYFALAGLLTGATFWAITRPDRHRTSENSTNGTV